MSGVEDVLTLEEASERIGVAVSTLRRQARDGVLRASRKGYTWLVTFEEIDRYAREHKGKPGRKRKESNRDEPN